GRPDSITAGTGAGQTRAVTSNTATTLTVSPAWTTTPDATSKYVILQTSTTLQDTTKTGTKAWTTDQWAGHTVADTAGTGAGQTRTVTSNTANTLTVSPAWTTIPDGTSKYAILNTSTTLQDTTKTWHNKWSASRCAAIIARTSAGTARKGTANAKSTTNVPHPWTTS